MTDNTTDFFDNLSEGTGAPTALLKTPGDFVHGRISKMFKRDYVKFGGTEVEKKADGSNKEQLVIVVETTFRNWQNVVKVPKVDPTDPTSAEKAPSEDTGERAIYVPEGTNIQFAIGRAVSAASQAAGQKVAFAVGGTIGVKIDKLTDTGKGNPLKEHEAVYTPPSAGDAFVQQAAPAPQAAPQAPVATPAPAPAAPAAQDPWAAPQAAPAAPAPAAVAQAQQDPWATSAPAPQAPPF